MTINDLKKIVYDIECYPNYLLVSLKDEKGNRIEIDTYDNNFIQKVEYLNKIKDKIILIGFNNSRYDSTILEVILTYYKTYTIEQLMNMCYSLSQKIIVEGAYPIVELRKLGIKNNTTYNLDLQNYCQTGVSLKEMGVRIGHPILENLPYEPTKLLSYVEAMEVKKYCRNDVDVTERLMKSYLSDKVKGTLLLIEVFNLPFSFISKSDGAIAQYILCDSSIKPVYPETFHYKAPLKFNFETPELQDLLKTYEGIEFNVKKMQNKECSFHRTLTLFGGLEVDVGLGGVHASKRKSILTNVRDVDAGSMYPNLLRIFGYYPNTFKDINIYVNMIKDRIKLKHSDNPQDVKFAKAYKIILNTVYGYMNFVSKNNIMYSPNNVVSICITGQLLLLKLGEMLYKNGYDIVYLNTDGLSFTGEGKGNYKEIISLFDRISGLDMEEDLLDYCAFRDVNNFIISKEGGKLKLKGDYNYELGARNYSFCRISIEAVKEFIINNVPIEETIKNCKDINKFVMYQKYGHRSYKDIGIYDYNYNLLEPMGNVVRFYKSTIKKNKLLARNISTGNYTSMETAVNIQPLFEIKSNDLPEDLDIDFYIKYAYKKLNMLNEDIEIKNTKVEGMISLLNSIFD